MSEMKNKVLIITLAMMVFSCSETNSPNEFFWGKMTCYDDFLWEKHKAEVMEKTLDFEFNEDAMTLLGNNVIELELIKKDEKGNYVKADNIHVYVDGEKCKDNIIKITPHPTSIRLGLQFSDPKNAKEGNHSYNLKVKNHGGLTRIDNVDLSVAHNVTLEHEWVVKKENVMNPLRKTIRFIWIGLLVLVIVWIIFLKYIIIPVFTFRNIEIKVRGISQVIRVKGYRKLICSDKKQKQSLLKILFAGKIKYFVDEFFYLQKIEFYPKNYGKKMVLKKHRLHKEFNIDCFFTMQGGNPIKINKEGEILTIRIL
jgi:hypothetical protein